jgi:tRNA-dihydrouridine synthase 3
MTPAARGRRYDEVLPLARAWGAAAATLHGRTRQQRYSRLADWSYIERYRV